MGNIKIIYDISPLGDSGLKQYKKTGIFRVTENILKQLLCRPDVTLNIYAGSGNYAACINYLNSNTAWVKDTFFIKPELKSLINIQDTVDTFIVRCSQRIDDGSSISFIYKVVRKIFRFMETALRILLRSRGERQLVKSSAEVDIYLSSLNTVPRCLKKTGIQRALLVYDLIPLLYPDFFKSGVNGGHFLNKIIESIDEKTLCICISECTKNDLLKIRSDLSEEMITVVYPGASDEFYHVTDMEQIKRIRNKYGIPAEIKYVLSLSTIEPRKNLKTVIASFEKALELYKDDDLYLVIAGPSGWMNDSLYQSIMKQEHLQKKVIFTGFVDDADLASLYSGAEMFIYLSYYEGFGLPVLEAMKCGTPVIASGSSSIPEVAGDACLLVDPDDIDAVARHILQLLESPDLCKYFSEKSLKRSEIFTWESFVGAILDSYQAKKMDIRSNE